MSQQQAGRQGAGGAPGQVPMPFPLVQNIAQLSELRLVHCCCSCWGAHLGWVALFACFDL